VIWYAFLAMICTITSYVPAPTPEGAKVIRSTQSVVAFQSATTSQAF
jgi:hypothetical protein